MAKRKQYVLETFTRNLVPVIEADRRNFYVELVYWNNTCFSKNLFTQFETIVVYAKLFLIMLFTPNRTKSVFAMQVVLR